MKLISLNRVKGRKFKGEPKFAQVDDEDFEYLNQFNWTYSEKGYARRFVSYRKEGKIKLKSISLHREIMNIVDPKILIDHRDRNGLNNQKSNLRIATKSGNGSNRKSAVNSSSKYLGVYKNTHRQTEYRKRTNDYVVREYIYWRVAIRFKGKQFKSVVFKTEENAAIAYNIYAEKYHGEFANYNKYEKADN